MELTAKDKVENVISAIIVIPHNNRLYDYYINGQEDKRVMLQRKMLQFCIDLCPKYATEIRKSIFELQPFIIYPQSQVFSKLQENDPPKIKKRSILFPMGKLVKEDKIDLQKEKETTMNKWAKNYSIWKNYNVRLEQEKIPQSKKLLNNRFD